MHFCMCVNAVAIAITLLFSWDRWAGVIIFFRKREARNTYPKNKNTNTKHKNNQLAALQHRLLAKAKASRAAKIQEERALEKNYVTKNNLKLDADTSKVQIAVYKLSKAGGLIDQGYPAGRIVCIHT